MDTEEHTWATSRPLSFILPAVIWLDQAPSQFLQVEQF